MEDKFIYFINAKHIKSKKTGKDYYILNYLTSNDLRYYTQFISQDFFDDICDAEYELFAELKPEYRIDFNNNARIVSLNR